MLTILNDPAGITGRQRHEWDFSKTLQENIAAHLDGGGDCEVSINGLRVDPLTDPRLDMPPSAFDLVMVARRPAGLDPVTWFYIATLALSVYAYTQLPKIPNVETAKESPNNSLTAQTNIARTYQAIPDVYGLRRVWPDLIQPSLIEYISNVKYVTEWMCISRGKGTITDVRYAETPIGEIDGASFQLFEPSATPSAYPEFNDTTLTDVVEAFSCPDVNGQELTAAQAYKLVSGSVVLFTVGSPTTNISLKFADGSQFDQIKAGAPVAASVRLYRPFGGGTFSETKTGTITSFSVASGQITLNITVASAYSGAVTLPMFAQIQPSGVSAFNTVGPFTLSIGDAQYIRWNTAFLRGLKASVDIQAEWWAIDNAGVEIGGTRENSTETYSANTFDQYFFTTEVQPTYGAGKYKVTFTRQNTPTTDGTDVAKLDSVFGVRKYATKTLPGVTVVRVTTKATAEATGFRDRKYNLRWQRHVRELTTDTISASRNFARSMAHVWSLAGEDITGLDTDALQTINTALGETADVLRFDGSFDDADVSLGERMQRIAWHARCSLWRDGTKWTVTRDQYQAYPAVQLDYRNLAAGGESSISYAAHLPATFDGVEIKYTDETTQAKAAYVRLKIVDGFVDVGLSRNPKKIDMPGCTTAAQALNRAHLEARRIMYQRTSVSDTALADAGALGIDSMVRWVDPNDFAGDDGLQAGEVMAIDVPNLRITTSEPVDWKGQTSGRILFTGTDGRQVGPTVVCTPFGALVQLAAMPAGLYVRDSTRQLGSRYAFSVGLTAAETEAAGLYVVTEIRPAQDRTVFLALAAYDDRMYSED